ncbi:hypothetical protein J2850_005543 [Azospirillum picis]|uniref:Uncharacterized protein n=1 Tax=Azospirillum picis TaxID=488438 RepID=A0ABU0MTV7_9PROT|nr:hypothetical protein [Azospirillum picis]MDQ0536536.1 hypothetical protein [Azospirillum picis]
MRDRGTTRIIIHIDHLVLRGVDRAEAAVVAAALEAELAVRIGRDPGLSALTGANGEAVVGAGLVKVHHTASATAFGRAVGANIACLGAKL